MTKRPHIAVFFDKPGFDDYPYTETEYRTAYRELAELLKTKGIEFAIVRDQKTFLGGNRFSGGWLFADNDFVRHDEPLTVDLVYNKGHFKPDTSSNVLNNTQLNEMCTDKWLSYLSFPSFFPKTLLAKNAEELRKALEKITTNIAVIKPTHGEEGHGVIIKAKSDIDPAQAEFPCIVQEYIDVTGGIPGIVDGPHDLRIICVRGEVGVSYVRTPPPKSLVANVAQGGREIEVLPENIPKGALEIFQTVEKQFSKFPTRIYSVDMGRDKDGSFKIIELNSKPGLSPRNAGKSYPRFHELIANALIAAAQSA